MPITCGNRAGHPDGRPATHATIGAVRACCTAERTWACDWLVPHMHPEDGEIYTLECGGLAWDLPDDRGHTCEFGHEHVHAEARHAEGWDYAADPEEAGLLAGRGVIPVAMDGGPIDIDTGAFTYAAALPGPS